MAFLTKKDFGSAIRQNILDAVIEFDDNLLMEVVDEVVGVMKSYLTSRYDVETIFSAEKDKRSPIVRMYCKNLVIGALYDRINSRKIPETRAKRYEEAMQWLRDVQGEISNPDLPKPKDESKNYMIFGSNEKRENHV